MLLACSSPWWSRAVRAASCDQQRVDVALLEGICQAAAWICPWFWSVCAHWQKTLSCSPTCQPSDRWTKRGPTSRDKTPGLPLAATENHRSRLWIKWRYCFYFYFLKQLRELSSRGSGQNELRNKRELQNLASGATRTRLCCSSERNATTLRAPACQQLPNKAERGGLGEARF